MDGPQHPGPDADASEIAEWMEDDFGRALTDGVENANERGKNSKEIGSTDELTLKLALIDSVSCDFAL
jgi:hypothetical protein